MRNSLKIPYLPCFITTISLFSTVESNLWELNPMGTAWEGLNYGCWCNVGENYNFSDFQKGSGQTVDLMDEICKNHHDDYDQALKNSAKEGAFCKPDDKIYNAGDDAGLILQGSWADARKNCVKANKGDTCAIDTCTADYRFIIDIFKAFYSPDWQFQAHFSSQNFDKNIQCPYTHGSQPMWSAPKIAESLEHNGYLAYGCHCRPVSDKSSRKMDEVDEICARLSSDREELVLNYGCDVVDVKYISSLIIRPEWTSYDDIQRDCNTLNRDNCDRQICVSEGIFYLEFLDKIEEIDRILSLGFQDSEFHDKNGFDFKKHCMPDYYNVTDYGYYYDDEAPPHRDDSHAYAPQQPVIEMKSAGSPGRGTYQAPVTETPSETATEAGTETEAAFETFTYTETYFGTLVTGHTETVPTAETETMGTEGLLIGGDEDVTENMVTEPESVIDVPELDGTEHLVVNDDKPEIVINFGGDDETDYFDGKSAEITAEVPALDSAVISAVNSAKNPSKPAKNPSRSAKNPSQVYNEYLESQIATNPKFPIRPDFTIGPFNSPDYCVIKKFMGYNNGDFLWVLPCDPKVNGLKNPEKYQWSYDQSTGMVTTKNSALSFCWTVHQNMVEKPMVAKRVTMAKCDVENVLQKFDYNGYNIHLRGDRKVCVGWNDGNQKNEGLGPVLAFKCFDSRV